MQGPRLLVVGINYAPEHAGIAPYTTQACDYLASGGAQVIALAGIPPACQGAPERRGVSWGPQLAPCGRAVERNEPSGDWSSSQCPAASEVSVVRTITPDVAPEDSRLSTPVEVRFWSRNVVPAIAILPAATPSPLL